MTSLQHWLTKAVPATPQERAAALWSFGYFFTLLAGYYVLRPLRDQMGIAGGVKALPWMFTATFVTLLVAQPLYGALVSRVTRARFIPVVYHFFVANLALFWLLLTAGVATVIVARVFFVWVSVFNLFAVAVYGFTATTRVSGMASGEYTAQVTRESPPIKGAAAGTPGAEALVSKQALIGWLVTPSFLADLK